MTDPLTVYPLPWVEWKAVPPKSLTLGQNLRLKKVDEPIRTLRSRRCPFGGLTDGSEIAWLCPGRILRGVIKR